MDGLETLKSLTGKLPVIPHGDKVVNVLVVENDPKARQLISHSLDYFGCKCGVASNGHEAMDILDSESFDVLLAHIIVAEEIGIGVMKKFQNKNPDSLIVIISGGEDKLRDYGKYLSILALPFGFYDLVKRGSI